MKCSNGPYHTLMCISSLLNVFWQLELSLLSSDSLGSVFSIATMTIQKSTKPPSWKWLNQHQFLYYCLYFSWRHKIYYQQKQNRIECSMNYWCALRVSHFYFSESHHWFPYIRNETFNYAFQVIIQIHFLPFIFFSHLSYTMKTSYKIKWGLLRTDFSHQAVSIFSSLNSVCE